jgi:hypothetical protein
MSGNPALIPKLIVRDRFPSPESGDAGGTWVSMVRMLTWSVDAISRKLDTWPGEKLSDSTVIAGEIHGVGESATGLYVAAVVKRAQSRS